MYNIYYIYIVHIYNLDCDCGPDEGADKRTRVKRAPCLLQICSISRNL